MINKEVQLIMKKELTIIGIIPQYPQHSQHNIYAKIKMPPVGIFVCYQPDQ